MPSSLVTLKNPHSVLAALQKRPKDVLEILVPAGFGDRGGASAQQGRDAWLKVVQTAQAAGVKVKNAQPQRSGGRDHRDLRDSRESHDAGRTGTYEAVVKEAQGISAEELFRGARARAGGQGLWLALDSLTDPHNVGAIFRTASFFGAQGIVLTQERSAPLTSAVYDVAAGGLEDVPFVLQTNLQRAFEIAKEQGLWILGTSEHAKQSYRQVERDRPWLLVVGNEEKGMRRLTEEACDVVCQVPPRGAVTSLNVSVAAGVLISALSG
jgi:23S rRNA (guanosine2251-2'-O)-methyltransferase